MISTAPPPDLVATPAAPSLAADVEALWRVFHSGRTRPLEWRIRQLDGLLRLLREREDELMAALRADLGKPRFEAFCSDVGAVRAEVALTRRLLPTQLRPRRVRTPLRSQPAQSVLYPEPWGAVLVLPAWNYPVGLAIMAVAGALAGGNTVALKPSELAPASTRVLAEQLPRYVDPDALRVVEGGHQVATELLRHRFGHIHLTGSSAVGRVVMRAAAEHLTPVTLELGGKNPAYVHRDADVESAARRIMWGRLFNAGQTCLSPDYVLVDREVERPLLAALTEHIRRGYGPDPRRSRDLARIVSERHAERLRRLLDGCGEIVVGGDADPAQRYVAPTVVRGVPDDHPLLHEEIFGPILPVVAVDGPDAALRTHRRPSPAAGALRLHPDRCARRALRRRDELGVGGRQPRLRPGIQHRAALRRRRRERHGELHRPPHLRLLHPLEAGDEGAAAARPPRHVPALLEVAAVADLPAPDMTEPLELRGRTERDAPATTVGSGPRTQPAERVSPIALSRSRYPTGWFQVAWSDELPVETVKLVRSFGQDIVLWRAASGQVNANDAYCLHLGANLGVGGRVEGENLVCPWHAWRWNGEGRNTLIPYSSQTCKKQLRLRTYPVRELHGGIHLWHDLLHRPPSWEPPTLEQFQGDARFYPVDHAMRAEHRVKTHPQLVVENGVDPAHIVPIHGAGEMPTIELGVDRRPHVADPDQHRLRRGQGEDVDDPRRQDDRDPGVEPLGPGDGDVRVAS